MAENSIEGRPLRELINDGMRLTRELDEHIDRGFRPKVRSLRRLVSPNPSEPEYEATEDMTIRNGAGQLLESDAFTAQVYSQIEAYCEAIDRTVAEILSSRSST